MVDFCAIGGLVTIPQLSLADLCSVARCILKLCAVGVDMGERQSGLANTKEVLSLIQWPALVKYADYEELGYIIDATAWEAEVGVEGAYLNPTDIVLDSNGSSFAVVEQVENQRMLQPTQKIISLDEVLSWVRAHASMQGHCCVAKLHASSIIEVFTILKSLDD